MKRLTYEVCVALTCVAVQSAMAGSSMELTPADLLSPGVNEIKAGILYIHKGRGSDMSWVVHASADDVVDVTIEYSNPKPLDQPYQFSLGGKIVFWDVPVQEDGQWTIAPVGSFTVKANQEYWISMAPPSNRNYPHDLQFKKFILKSHGTAQLVRVGHFSDPKKPDAQLGFGEALASPHPSLQVRDVSPPGQALNVMGIQAFGDQQALVTTLEGKLYRVDWSQPNSRLTLIAESNEQWADALWYKQRMFVLAKSRILELKDNDHDGIFETSQTLADDWETTSDMYDRIYGGVVVDNHLYFASGVAMGVRETHNRQVPLRGSAFKVNLDTGKTTLLAGGLRTPNGMCVDANHQIFLSDNQGEWLPTSKIIHLQDQAFYGFRYRPTHPLQREVPTPPALWIPYEEVSLSPTEPIFLDQGWGVYAGQGLLGDMARNGLIRFCLERVNGVYQGAVFRWSQGLDFKINRLTRITDSSILAGRLARGNHWDKAEHHDSLKLLQYHPSETFEILKVAAKSNGFELVFTKPLNRGFGWNANNIHMERWRYEPTQLYGGKKLFHNRVIPRSLSVSENGRTLFVETPELETGQVIYFRLPAQWTSDTGQSLWSGEAWYTLNEIPTDSPGVARSKPAEVSPAADLFTYQSKESGRTLYQQYCMACHSLDAKTIVGPSFHRSLGPTRKVVEEADGTVRDVNFNRQYITESILTPNAKAAEGYPRNIMPSFGSILSPAQIDMLSDYVYQMTAEENETAGEDKESK
ncbi:c-type cytochrome [Planctomycetales bacterium ZRK34]|nr:c-type cytochrome [Planctomycetales bacterium ZRK34]